MGHRNPRAGVVFVCLQVSSLCVRGEHLLLRLSRCCQPKRRPGAAGELPGVVHYCARADVGSDFLFQEASRLSLGDMMLPFGPPELLLACVTTPAFQQYRLLWLRLPLGSPLCWPDNQLSPRSLSLALGSWVPKPWPCTPTRRLCAAAGWVETAF